MGGRRAGGLIKSIFPRPRGTTSEGSESTLGFSVSWRWARGNAFPALLIDLPHRNPRPARVTSGIPAESPSTRTPRQLPSEYTPHEADHAPYGALSPARDVSRRRGVGRGARRSCRCSRLIRRHAVARRAASHFLPCGRGRGATALRQGSPSAWRRGRPRDTQLPACVPHRPSEGQADDADARPAARPPGRRARRHGRRVSAPVESPD